MAECNKEFEKWVDLYTEKLLVKAIFLLTDENIARDMVQEVFLSAYNSYSSFEKKSQPFTWLCSILSHKVADFYRKKYHKNTPIYFSHFFDKKGNWNFDVIDDDSGLEKDIYVQFLQECIEALPDRWKILVKLYYIQEKKTANICKEIGITPSNLWKILQRSRLQMKECIELKNNEL